MSTTQQALLADLDHWYGNDLTTTNSGDLQTVTSTIRGQQRVLRRLLTNPGSYIWEPNYGAGLGQYVGRPIDVPKMTALILAQLQLESVVASTPIPSVSISQSVADLTQFTVTVKYTDQPTNEPVVLTFTVSN